MISSLILLLSSSLIGVAVPQAPAAKSPSDAVVLKKTWRRIRIDPAVNGLADVAQSPGFGRGGPVDANAPPIPPVRTRPRTEPYDRYTYEVKIQNSGRRTIVEIGWDYVFSRTGDKEPCHHRFVDRIRLKPGRERTLSHSTKAPPLRTVSTTTANSKLLDEAIIIYVKYDDGSSWEAPPE